MKNKVLGARRSIFFYMGKAFFMSERILLIRNFILVSWLLQTARIHILFSVDPHFQFRFLHS